MNIRSTQAQPLAFNKPAKATSKPQTGDRLEVASAFSVDRDLTYAVGATLAQIPGRVVGVTGSFYGAPQLAASAVGGIMAAAGARELMISETLHGRINGGIHLAVGAMTAAAPWSGNLAGGLYLTSIAALGVKALIDSPGNIFKTAAMETGSMVKEVFTPWTAQTTSAS